MPNINITVTDKQALVQGAPVIVCGNSDYTVTFTFDEEWDAYEAKTARFGFIREGKALYTDVIFSGNQCTAPVLSNTRCVMIGVYAGDLRTTTPAQVPCQKSILCGAPSHEDPPADVYNQLMQMYENMNQSIGDINSVLATLVTVE